MDARATAKYVKAVGTIAYAQPEILALPQETLDAIMLTSRLPPIVLLWKTCCVQSLTP